MPISVSVHLKIQQMHRLLRINIGIYKMSAYGALRSSSETASRNLPLTSASFARKRVLRGCGSFSRLYTFYAAPLWNTLGNLMKGSITSEIVFYRQLSFKMPFHCNRVILCIFRDLLIYSCIFNFNSTTESLLWIFFFENLLLHLHFTICLRKL